MSTHGAGHTADPDREGAGTVPEAVAELPSNATQPGGAPKATEEPGRGDANAASKDLPAAGPHADPSLINPDATPGTGALPPAGAHDNTDSTSS